ncbi:hypothetical protein D3C80_1524300 [compost metagenome]
MTKNPVRVRRIQHHGNHVQVKAGNSRLKLGDLQRTGEIIAPQPGEQPGRILIGYSGRASYKNGICSGPANNIKFPVFKFTVRVQLEYMPPRLYHLPHFIHPSSILTLQKYERFFAF